MVVGFEVDRMVAGSDRPMDGSEREESPGSAGQGGRQLRPAVRLGKVPQKTNRRWVAAATTGKGEKVR